ncbi:hypothetical protein [Mesobacillus foraminis]|uniref:hypothetical protein n=1 Tax=Mesobacillus foraminis TaxID=279826 RepID=UPI00214C8BD8|nr:hypothetical protein [Mesobacillus foraminis]
MNAARMDSIIEHVTEGIYRDYPALLKRFGERGREKCREDNEHHIRHLQTSLKLGDHQFFIDYAHWLNGILTSRGMETSHLIDNFERLQEAFCQVDPTSEDAPAALTYNEFLDYAIASLKETEIKAE